MLFFSFPDIHLVRPSSARPDAAAGRFAPQLQFAGGGVAQQSCQAAVVGDSQQRVLFQVVLCHLQALFGRVLL